jgi:anthranilate phosphoribosyltransferase
MLNPAGACYQVLGVGRPDWLDLVAGALAWLGTRHALVVHGADGLDEVSLSATTHVREVRHGSVAAYEWTPRDFGLSPCTLDELRAATQEQSAAVIRSVLAGHDGPAARVVLANAAAALLAAEHTGTLAEGVALAREVLAGGRALQVLQRLATTSHEPDAARKEPHHGNESHPPERSGH